VGADVLIGGERRPLAGVVTMDQLLVDCGTMRVQRDDEVVLIGRQGAAYVGAEQWAEKLGTISYEIVCGISARVPRQYTLAPPTSGAT
jgi:alanine racemase